MPAMLQKIVDECSLGVLGLGFGGIIITVYYNYYPNRSRSPVRLSLGTDL